MPVRKYDGWYRVNPGDALLINDDYPGWTIENWKLAFNRPLYPWKLVYENNEWSYWAGQYSTINSINWWLGRNAAAFAKDPDSWKAQQINPITRKKELIPIARDRIVRKGVA